MRKNLRAKPLSPGNSESRQALPGQKIDSDDSEPQNGTTPAGIRILTPVLTLTLALLPAATWAQWTQLGQDLDGEAAYDWSGISVSFALDGSRLAVGARLNDEGGNNSGHARVFDWDHATASWIQIGDDINGEAEDDHSGDPVALSSDGSRLAIAALGNDQGGTFAGHVRVFEWDDGSESWVQIGDDIDGVSAYDNMGSSLALSSDGYRLAVGALGFDANGSDSGRVRVFEWDGASSNWIQLGSAIDGEAAHDFSGFSMALSTNGSRVAIGASQNDGNGSESGHVRVFEWDVGSTDWVQIGEDINGEAANDYSGEVAISQDGNRLAIGASRAGATRGQVRVFEWDGGSSDWAQLGDDIDGEDGGDFFGTSVALSSEGARLAVGASGSGTNVGQVRAYSWQDPIWVQIGEDIDGEAEGDQSGFSVALSSEGGRLAIGAIYNDNDNGEDAGHVRVYSDSIFSDGFESGTTAAWSS